MISSKVTVVVSSSVEGTRGSITVTPQRGMVVTSTREQEGLGRVTQCADLRFRLLPGLLSDAECMGYARDRRGSVDDGRLRSGDSAEWREGRPRMKHAQLKQRRLAAGFADSEKVQLVGLDTEPRPAPDLG